MYTKHFSSVPLHNWWLSVQSIKINWPLWLWCEKISKSKSDWTEILSQVTLISNMFFLSFCLFIWPYVFPAYRGILQNWWGWSVCILVACLWFASSARAPLTACPRIDSLSGWERKQIHTPGSECRMTFLIEGQCKFFFLKTLWTWSNLPQNTKTSN